MLVGSYLDAMYSQATTQFAATHPEMFTQKGSLRAEFDHAELMYDRMKCDPLMSQYNNGAQQVIMTRELFETPWKIMIDSYHKDKCIVDRKKCRDFEDMWKNGRKMPWIEYWGYDIQATVYQAVEGNSLPFIISAVTSETVPDIDLLYIPQDIMDSKMSEIAERLPRILNVKRGLEAPTRLTADPERSASGTTFICKFTLAVNRDYNREKTDFLNIVCFNKTAEIASVHLFKGSQVAIKGSIQVDTYEKDGKKQYYTSIVADRVEFVGSKPQETQVPEGFTEDEAPGEWKSDKTVEDYLDYCPKCYEN
ncbi:hypothetical protein B566_EDAN018031 [Ephemera danica]|nr:hypothetical protein B566_EDAN018031 [Ephemera danica]